MIMLSCARCGQRYYGPQSQMARCPFCQGPLEEMSAAARGRRTDMMPLPVVSQPQSVAGAPVRKA
jgi:hypothetical protein